MCDQIVGAKFGSITPIVHLGCSLYQCECDCGRPLITDEDALFSGRKQSCGSCHIPLP